MSNTSISRIAYILAIIEGILLVLFGLFEFIGFSGLAIFHFGLYSFAYAGIVAIICGVNCNHRCQKRRYSGLGNCTHNRCHHRRWLRRNTSCFGRTTWNHFSLSQKSIDPLELDLLKSIGLFLEASRFFPINHVISRRNKVTFVSCCCVSSVTHT